MKTSRIGPTLAAGLLLMMGAGAPGAQQEPPSAVVRLDEILKAHPLKEGDNQTSVELMRGEGVSAHLLQVRSRVRPHYHKDHSETVYLLEGSGILIVGDRAYPVKMGSLIMIPRGVIHSFEAKQSTSVLSIFDPPFDGADRIFVDEPAPSP
ncbi:MAG: cupin domain-containing protein [Acidobacteria bacterium]|nr:cupin domain-containing protein [Acidobacteriota bacterium]